MERLKIEFNNYLYCYVSYEDNTIELVSDGNCPSGSVSINHDVDEAYINFFGKPQLMINLKTGDIKSFYNRPTTTEVKNLSEIISNGAEDKSYLKNESSFRRNDTIVTHNKTDLHTHFMEVLSGEEFLNVILGFTDQILLDKNGQIPRAYQNINYDVTTIDGDMYYWVTRKEIYENPVLFDTIAASLSLRSDKQVDFLEINKVLTRRTALLDLVGLMLKQEEIRKLTETGNQLNQKAKELISDAKGDIYKDILVETLVRLKSEGVKYVELSYSTPNTIRRIKNRLTQEDKKRIAGIEYAFLLSENRMSSGEAFREYSNKNGTKKRNKKSVSINLGKLIDEGYVIGFDLMGMEDEIQEKDYEKDTPDSSSLYDKLEDIMLVLNSFNNPNVVCRLHAGEIYYSEANNIDGKSNPERTLEIIDSIVKDHHLILPPPTIRLGHALHFIPTENYLRLLKKYNVVVEINASSNFALSNIKDLSDIPYKWYQENNVPFVLGTDGEGFYYTTVSDEEKLAVIFGGEKVQEHTNETDEYERMKRGI